MLLSYHREVGNVLSANQIKDNLKYQVRMINNQRCLISFLTIQKSLNQHETSNIISLFELYFPSLMLQLEVLSERNVLALAANRGAIKG